MHFRTREGRLQAARNLLEHEIDSLVVIGGDGSLTGANIFRQEWPACSGDWSNKGQITPEVAAQHPFLTIVGLVGSIDNDMFGTDMTIGADTALHRITEAVDAITSTAASHQRTFVVKVMGRNCGYLALMGALATGADWVLIPESPPGCGQLARSDVRAPESRAQGRPARQHRDHGRRRPRPPRELHRQHRGCRKCWKKPWARKCASPCLGHVQRGGSPSAFDRNLGTLHGPRRRGNRARPPRPKTSRS